MRTLRPTHLAAERPDEDRTPLVAARRRASLLATLGCLLLVASVAAVLLGRGTASVTLVTPDHKAAESPREPAEEVTEVVGVDCGPWTPGQLRYEVRFDDGSRVTRVAAPVDERVEVGSDPSTGLAFPGVVLRFTERADGSWTCSVVPS